MRRVAILISGGGSNMVALLEEMAKAGAPAAPALVLSNDPNAGGLARAAARGVATAAIDHRPFGKDRPAFEAEIHKALAAAEVDLVCLAGFMRILTPGFVDAWRGRMINIHPSLLPLFTGLNTHQRAIDAGCAVHGCTVHEVIPELDAGPILGQAVVPVLPGDDADTLAARVLVQEHRLYPMALSRFARGETGRFALFDPAP